MYFLSYTFFNIFPRIHEFILYMLPTSSFFLINFFDSFLRLFVQFVQFVFIFDFITVLNQLLSFVVNFTNYDHAYP